MATGSLDANGIWLFGEDDSEPTFSGLLNKLGDSTSDSIGRVEYTPYLTAVKSTNTNLNAATYTVLTYQTIGSDQITQTSSSRFTITQSGVYLINARQNINNTSWGTLRVYVNGSMLGISQQEQNRSGVSSVELTEVALLDVGYYVEIFAISDGNYPATSGTLSIAMLSAR